MDSPILPFLVIAAALVAFALGALVVVFKFYRRVDHGQALIINKIRVEPLVSFTGGFVLPIVHRAEIMDITVKSLTISRRGREALRCRGEGRVDAEFKFLVRVDRTPEGVLEVARTVGCARAFDPATLEELFAARFAAVLRDVAVHLEAHEIVRDSEAVRDAVLAEIGCDLGGYVLDGAVVVALEQRDL